MPALFHRVPIPFDIAFKLVNENQPRELIALITDISPDTILESYDRELNLETTRADHLFLVQDASGKSLLHLEALTSYHSGWTDDQIRKAAQISLKYWLPLRSFLILLTRKRVPKSVPQHVQCELGSFRMQLSVEVVRLWEIPARRALALDSVALCPWIQLMDSTDEDRDEAENRIVASGNRDLGLLMAIFAGLRYGNKREVLERLDKMFTVQDLMESSFIRDLLEEGRAEGEARGEAQGRAQGIAQGKAATLHRLLTKRFGTVPSAVEARIAAAEEDQLDKWLDGIIDARSIADIFVQ